MPKFLVLSDIHLNIWNFGHPEDRLKDTIKVIDKSIQYGVLCNVDAILFCGDIFHTHGAISTIVLSHLYDCLYTWKDWLIDRAVYIPGNHDLVFKHDSATQAVKFLNFFGKVASWGETFNVNGMPAIYAIPFVEDEHYLRQALSKAPVDSIVMLHQGVSGVEVNNKGFTINEILKPDMIPDHICHAFTGHYHTRKVISSKLTIPGALVQHNFADAGEIRGPLLVELDSEGLKFQILQFDSFTFERLSFEEFETKKFEIEGNWRKFFSVENVPSKAAIDVEKFMSRWSPGHRILTIPEKNPFQTSSTTTNSIEVNLDLFCKDRKLDENIINIGKELIS